MANNQIALLARAPEFETPLESQGKALKIRDMMNQAQVQDMDMQQRREAIQRAAGLRSTLAGFKPDATPDEQVGELTRGGYLTEARTVAESSAKVNKDKREAEKAEREAEKFQLEGMFKKLEFAGQLMGGVTDQVSWTRARQKAIQALGADAASDMPEQYDPALVEQNRQQARSMKEQLENHWKKMGFDLEVKKAAEAARHNKAQEGITVRGQNMVDTRAREAADFAKSQPRGQVLQTDQGPMLVDPRNGTMRPVTGLGGKPAISTKAPTEFQGKSAAFGLRATEADKILRVLESKGVTDTGIIKSIASGAGEMVPFMGDRIGPAIGSAMNMLPGVLGGPNEGQQQTEQARRDFVNAVLRQESGAAIGPSEFENATRQYFPQPGDTAAVRAQKARNRALAIQGLQSNAGRAAMTAPGTGASAASGIQFLGFEE